MAKEKEYWFKAKRYGWGWGLPRTWQGWVSFGVFIAVWLWALYALIPVDGTELPAKNITVFVVIMVLDVAGLTYVSFKHGEAPKSLSKVFSFGTKPSSSDQNPSKTRQRNSSYASSFLKNSASKLNNFVLKEKPQTDSWRWGKKNESAESKSNRRTKRSSVQ